jgi:hypothetical protein
MLSIREKHLVLEYIAAARMDVADEEMDLATVLPRRHEQGTIASLNSCQFLWVRPQREHDGGHVRGASPCTPAPGREGVVSSYVMVTSRVHRTMLNLIVHSWLSTLRDVAGTRVDCVCALPLMRTSPNTLQLLEQGPGRHCATPHLSIRGNKLKSN